MMIMFNLCKWIFPILSLVAIVIGSLIGSTLWIIAGSLFLASCLWFKVAVSKAASMPARRWSLLFGIPLLIMISVGTVISLWGVSHYAGIVGIAYIAGLATNPLIRLLRKGG